MNTSTESMRPLIDVHLHVGSTVARVPPVVLSVEEALARMGAAGITAAILSPTGGDDLSGGNNAVIERNDARLAATLADPVHFPLALADAELRFGPDLAAAEVRRTMRLGMAGVCLNPQLAGARVGPVLRRIFEELDAHGGLCLLHPTAGTLHETAALIAEFSAVTVIYAHACMEADVDTLKLLRDSGRVWFDTSRVGLPSIPEISELIEVVGASRMLFASDLPYASGEAMRGRLLSAVEDDLTRSRIAWRNALGLIQRWNPAWDAL